MTKVLYNVKVDNFEMLTVKGLFEKFKDQANVTMFAMANGVTSRPTVCYFVNAKHYDRSSNYRIKWLRY